MKYLSTMVFLILSTIANAQPLMLVTEAEVKASMEVGGLPTPGAPRIELVSPDIKKAVTMPTKIEVKFSGNAPAEPKPETFKALYGAFKIDITQRLLGVAKVTKEGINVSDATLPSGKHQLLLMLTDTLGRETQQVVSFTVQ
jgi:hypothetical protein